MAAKWSFPDLKENLKIKHPIIKKFICYIRSMYYRIFYDKDL